MGFEVLYRAWTLALRELRSGFAGFRIFSACLALGVMAIVGVGSLSEVFLEGLAEQGRVLLGGDVAVNLVHRSATASELAFFSLHGRLSETVSMRAMAYAVGRAGRLGDRQIVELKAVDGRYPLLGRLGLTPDQHPSAALACDGGVCGAAVEQTLLDRLQLRVGDTVRIGVEDFRIHAVLQQEPDRISNGFSLGPHIMIASRALAGTGLVRTGSLINYSYRIALSRASPSAFQRESAAQFPAAGWEIRTRENAAPGIRTFIEQVTMFLMLVSLAALAIAGVGAAQAISAYLDRKRDEIAILKALGAAGDVIFLTYFLQVAVIALGAIIAGIGAGIALPFFVERLYGSQLPLPAKFAVFWQPIGLGALFGFLSSAAFSIMPLSRARAISPAGLFRDLVAPSPKRGSVTYIAASVTCGLAVVAIALYLVPSPLQAGEFLGGTLAILFLLRLIAAALQRVLLASPRPSRPMLRLALANLTRPGTTLASVVTALGLGLSLLAAITLLNKNISVQVNDALPEKAPTFFFVDIQPDEVAEFDRTVRRFPSATEYKRSPMIRGRIVALNGVPASQIKARSDARWALAGDRGITYAASPPAGTDVTEGRWWSSSYTGPTLVSFDGDLAPGLGLKLGDTITLNVLGREIEGRIANFRHVNFRNGQQNFILILSPGVIDKAPHTFLATVRVAPSDEEPLYRAVTDRFPNISVVRVKDSIAQVSALLQELAIGIRTATFVTILAGLLVLAGAIAAGGSARLYDATILKVLGATRTRIMSAYALEYGFLGLLTSLVALAFGALAAFAISRWILDVPFLLDIRGALTTIVVGGGLTLIFGMIGAWSALSARSIERLHTP